MKLNLIATNQGEELIKAYLEQNASDTLADKINNGSPIEKDGKHLINRKTLAGFFTYATEEAKKIEEASWLITEKLTRDYQEEQEEEVQDL